MEKKQTPDSLESIAKACDEAEDLLAELDESDLRKKQDELRENSQVEPIHSTAAGSESSDGGASGCLWILGIGLAIVIGAALTNQEEDNSLSRNYASQAEYNQAMETARNAVLISEHNSAIGALEEIKRKGIKPATMDNGLLNNKIIQARNKIKFLDQKGKSSYNEYGNYGYQWYDENDPNAYKIFFAYSNKCKQPLITFKYLRGQGGPLIKRRYVTPRATTSTIRVPYLPNESGVIWLYVDEFKCN